MNVKREKKENSTRYTSRMKTEFLNISGWVNMTILSRIKLATTKIFHLIHHFKQGLSNPLICTDTGRHKQHSRWQWRPMVARAFEDTIRSHAVYLNTPLTGNNRHNNYSNNSSSWWAKNSNSSLLNYIFKGVCSVIYLKIGHWLEIGRMKQN